MGGLTGRGESAQQQQQQALAPAAAALGPYPDDGARRMPNANSPAVQTAGRRAAAKVTQRSGRVSTKLTPDTPGTKSYTNSFIGSVS